MLTRDAAYMMTPEPSWVNVAEHTLLRLWLAALAHSHMVPPILKESPRSFLLPPVKLVAGGFN